ncbi:MAG: hypothetical protein E7214_04740 [Clostridium sp.]|nr:hypothetical protein [Clostridium sp.]
MNNRGLQTVVYILIGLLVVGFIFRILPYLLLGGIVAYGAYKCYKFIESKFGNKNQKKFQGYTYNNSPEQVENTDDEDISQAIDVDYKDL